MDNSLKRRKRARLARVRRVRKGVRGTMDRPRLTVSKTNAHIYAQLIDDVRGMTIAGLGTQSKSMKGNKSKEAARAIGTSLAQVAKEKNIETVVFDRGRYKFHGIIAELANAAREAGLQF